MEVRRELIESEKGRSLSGAPGAPPGPVGRRRWSLGKVAIAVIAGLVVGIVVLVVLADFLGGPSGRTPLSAVAVGECFDGGRFGESGGQVAPVLIVDCAQPHDGQVFTQFEWQGTEQATTFPGEEQVNDFARSTCIAEVGRLVNIVDRFPGAQLAYTYPLPSDWSRGEREFKCIVQGPPGEKLVGDVMSPAD